MILKIMSLLLIIGSLEVVTIIILILVPLKKPFKIHFGLCGDPISTIFLNNSFIRKNMRICLKILYFVWKQ